MPYDDSKKVIFLHVPKTGGTTIKRLLGIGQLDDPSPTIIPSPQHLTCRLLRERLGPDKYEKYYKFTFVRNPWARLLSDYFWRQQLPKKRPVMPFDQFVKSAANTVRSQSYYSQEFGDHFIPQMEYALDVDDVFKFHNFKDGLWVVAAKLGIQIGSIADKVSKPYDEYWKYYNNVSRKLVLDTYSEEIERFGFEFETG